MNIKDQYAKRDKLQSELKELNNKIAASETAMREKETPPEGAYFSYAWKSFGGGMRQTIKNGEVIKVIGIPTDEAKRGYDNQVEGK